MTKNYRALQVELEARPDHDQRAAEAKAALGAQDDAYFRRLSELRHARHMTQVALAERLHMVQPSISRLERQADLYVSTLRRYIEAIGGRLEIHAVFPDLDAELRLDDFEALDRDNPDVGDASKLREAL
ncbi:MAG: XRE family transcriptional regulator [Pseudonocardiaceae bacterium]